jgi:hypothetical protein
MNIFPNTEYKLSIFLFCTLPHIISDASAYDSRNLLLLI